MDNSIVKYEIPTVEKQISLFKYFLNLDERFKNNLYSEYPELRDQELETFVTSVYKMKDSELEEIKNNVQISWNKVEENILKEFPNILEKEWQLELISGGISLLPFSTRDLKEKRFDVFYKKDIPSILKTTTHELFHFIFFDKWKELFPNTTLEEMDYPNPIWALSEIVLPIMLNDSKVVDILGMKFNSYNMFDKDMFNGEKIVDHIQNRYRDNSLEEFLKESNEYIRMYYENKNHN